MEWISIWPTLHILTQMCQFEIHGARIIEVEVVTLGIPNLSGISSLPFTGPAIDTAVEELNHVYAETFNLSHSYVTSVNATNCLEMPAYSDLLLSEWFYKRKRILDVTAFISPTCLEMFNVNRLTSSWNMLMLTSVASSTVQRNKLLSPTWIAAISASVENYVLLFINVLTYFKWSSVFVILDRDSSATYTAGALPFENKRISDSVPDGNCIVYYVNSKSTIDYDQLLHTFRYISRVLILLAHSTILRDLMLHALRANMTNGEYVYIALEPSFNLRDFGNFSWHYGDSNDVFAKEAYRSVLLFGAGSSVDDLPSAAIVDSWKRRSLEKYNYRYGPDERIGTSITATYLAFLMFGQVLNETIVSNQAFDLKNGAEFTRLFFNRTYNFNFTTIYIDQVGERNTDLTVKDLNFASGKFEVVCHADQSTHKLTQTAVIDWGGMRNSSDPPLNEPACGYLEDQGPCADPEHFLVVYPSVAVALLAGVLLGSTIATYVIRKRRNDQEWRKRWWLVDPTLLTWKTTGSFSLHLINSNFCEPTHDEQITTLRGRGRARYMELDVWVDSVEGCDKLYRLAGANGGIHTNLSQELQLVLTTAIKNVHSDNINRLLGICCSPHNQNTAFFLSDFCLRGTLHDLFQYPQFDTELRSSLITNLLEGMDWIHASRLKFHGSLTGWKCLIDKHFTLKISEFGYDTLWRQLTSDLKFQRAQKIADPFDLFWTAPEVLRQVRQPDYRLVDVYAVGIIMNEICTGRLPYSYFKLQPSEIVEQIRKGISRPVRPEIQLLDELPKALEIIIERCWEESPKERLTISAAKKLATQALQPINDQNSGMIDKICKRLEVYAETLETEVTARTKALVIEREKCDVLLCEMLPRNVVEQLRVGINVEPEAFDSITVMFSDLVGFSDQIAAMEPVDVTKLLNAIYSIFDNVLVRFNVYKVETIGEVYMHYVLKVASGLPLRNGRDHVKEVCSLALALRPAFRDLSISATNLALRSGVNSGPCVAGIVGHRKPRYCLFGDTINSASRMESFGLANKIQISSATERLLRDFSGNFRVVERGCILVKGKGEIITYWLECPTPEDP